MSLGCTMMSTKMIERRKKTCKGCGLPQYIWARGYCKACDPGKPKREGFDSGLTPIIMGGQSTGKTFMLEEKIALNVFFAEQALLVPKLCENCKQELRAYDLSKKRFVTAHILPKATFPSVATHPLNRMFLGVSLFSECSCHGSWDNGNAQDRQKMYCFVIALTRIQDFIYNLTPHEFVKAEKYLGIEL